MPRPEAIDLGLSVKWASFNVGASAPEEYGDYYAWGETNPKTTYSLESYTWFNCDVNPNEPVVLKYNGTESFGTVDGKSGLELSDDAANTVFGNDWRMPTKEEWQELKQECTWTWTTLNGVYGYSVVSNSNGNSIFLPAASGKDDSDISDLTEGEGVYWSSTLYSNIPYYAWGVYFDGRSIYLDYDNIVRCYGLSVRAVQDNTDGPNMGDDVAGALPGEFSVSETTYVNFSKGNLQATYNGTDYTWGFAANQYDCIGSAAGNTTIGSSQTSGAVVDLFGWSTDGTNYGISLSTDNSDYSGDFVDWGKNIGDGSTWRTLTEDEWFYLLKERTNASSLYKYGVTVCDNTNCLIIAPDGFAGTIATSYDTSTWPAAEAAGLVCLPAAGARAGSLAGDVGDYGYYCSSSARSDDYVIFEGDRAVPDNVIYRYAGISVRLVTESN